MNKLVNNCCYPNLLFLLGILTLSPFSLVLFKDLLGLPTAFPELFLIFYLIFTRKSLNKMIKSCNNLSFWILIWIILFAIAVFVNVYSFSSVLANSRSWLLLFILASYSQRNINQDDVLYLSFGSIIGWMLTCFFSVRFMINNGDFMGTTGNLLAIPLFLSLSLQRNKKMFYIGILPILIICFLSGVRRALFVTVLSLIIILIRRYFNPKYIVRISILISAIYSLLLYFIDSIKDLLYQISPMLYVRTFDRYGSDDSADQDRLNMIIGMFEDMFSYIMPHGFYSSRTDIDGTGKYIDLPLSGLIYIFGFPIVAFIIFCFVLKYFKLLKMYFKNQNSEYFAYAISLLLCFSFLFFEGSFIAVLYATPLTGICIGKLLSLTKK